MLRRSARTSAASTAPGGARAGARRSRHPATHGAHRTEPEAMPAAGAGQGERGEVCDKRGAKRRREENAAVVTPMPSNAAPAAADRHAAVSEASRRASGARSDRRERRREGYPPEGARPRSGLDRVARSRSDAPRLILWSRDIVSMFGTIDCITVCTVVSSIGGRVSDSIVVTTIGTGIATNIGIAAGARRTLSASVARSSGGRAAEPPRSAAPQAPGDAKSGRAAVRGVRPKKKGRAAEATRPVVAMRPMPRRAAPGCRARRPCRPGCR